MKRELCGERGLLIIVKKKGFCYADSMNTIIKYFNRVIFFLFPISFIPIITDGFGLGKTISLAVLAFLSLILWTIKLITDKEKVVKTNKLFWLFLVFVIWSGVTFFRLEVGARMASLMSPIGMGTLVSLFVLFFVWLQVNDKEETKKQFLFLTISGVVAGIVSLIVFLLPANKLPLLIPKTNPLVSITANWSLISSILAEAILFIFLVFVYLKKLLKKIKEKADFKAYLMEAVTVAFFSLLLLLDIYRIFKAGWTFLDFKTVWIIATETFKNHPIFGLGIGNFLEGFNLYRPISFNLTNYWSSVFTASSMGIFQVWTELGLVGLFLGFYLVAMVAKLKKSTNFWKVVLFLVASLLLPLNIVTLFLLVWVLSGEIVATKETKLILNVGEKNLNVMPYAMAVLILVGVGFGSFWIGKIFLGDLYMRKSFVTAAKNDGTKTYEYQIKAIGFNSNLASYRKVYSQVNLSLAEAILKQSTVSDADKEKASTLVQQSVREAKAAVTLDSKNPEYWYNLAGIYKSLVGLVDGAADWSYQAYQQAVALDTVNPTYYLDMGGLLYAAEQYESAERAFEQSVTVKNDFANAWYNWAYAAKQQNKLSAAVTRLEKSLTLVPADSTDYTAAVKELETWKAELAKLVEQQEAAAKAAQTQQQTQQTQQTGNETVNDVTGLSPTDLGTQSQTTEEETLAPPATEVTGTMTQP